MKMNYRKAFLLTLLTLIVLCSSPFSERSPLSMTSSVWGQDQNSAGDAYKKGADLCNKGMYHEAIEELTRAVELDKNFSLPYDFRGISYMRLFEYDKAEADFLRGLEIDPGEDSIRMSLAVLYFVKGDFEKSSEELSRVDKGYESPFKFLPKLLDGPFSEEFPGVYPKFEGLTTKKRYMLYSDVGVKDGSEREKLRKSFADSDPKSPTTQKNKAWRKATKKGKEWKYIAHIQETMYDKYAAFFGHKKKPEVLFKTYVFANREEFERVSDGLGSPVSPTTQGYYDPTYKVLVLFNQVTGSGARKGVGNEMISTLFHESLHQFMDQLVSNSPTWFNEGVASYFEQSTISTDGKKVKIGVFNRSGQGFKSRYSGIKEMLAANTQWPLTEFIRISDEAWDERSIDGYAQAWSLIYFMMNQKDLKRVLIKYYDALRECKGNEYAIEKSFGSDKKIRMIEKRWLEFMKKL